MVELVIRTCYKMNPCFFASWNEDKPVLNSQWYSRHCKQDTEICWVTLFCLGLEDGEDEAEISISKIYCLLFCSVLWEYILYSHIVCPVDWDQLDTLVYLYTGSGSFSDSFFVSSYMQYWRGNWAKADVWIGYKRDALFKKKNTNTLCVFSFLSKFWELWEFAVSELFTP